MNCKRYLPVFGLVVALLGCGDSTNAVTVTGTVTFKEKPMPNVNVMFVPTDKTGIIAQGTSDENGKFWLQTLNPKDGAIPGDYKVSFKYVSEIVPDMPGFSGGVKPEKSPLPLQYEDENKSGFTATVKSSSENNFTFDLK